MAFAALRQIDCTISQTKSIDPDTVRRTARTRTRFGAGVAALALMLAAALPAPGHADDYIDKTMPAPTGSPAPLNQKASLDLPDLGGLSGGTLKRVLSTPTGDRGELKLRGKHDAEIYRAISPQVVLIVTDNAIGSGSYIGNNQVLTNFHVIKGAQRVGVIFKPRVEGDEPDKNDLRMAVVAKSDPVLDLALLQFSDTPPDLRPIAFAGEADIQVGADVHAIGHPIGQVWTYTKGIISQYRRDYEWQGDKNDIMHKANVIQTQTPISPGNSGGPLLTDDGKLLGVNSFRKLQGENLNYAVSIMDVQRFLASGAVTPAKATRPGSCQIVKLYDGRESKNTAGLQQYDTDCDGKVDFSIVTPDDKNLPVLALIDTNHDDKPDIRVE